MKELGVRLSMDDLNEMMSAADINQDGRIDYAGNDDDAVVAHCSCHLCCEGDFLALKQSVCFAA